MIPISAAVATLVFVAGLVGAIAFYLCNIEKDGFFSMLINGYTLFFTACIIGVDIICYMLFWIIYLATN